MRKIELKRVQPELYRATLRMEEVKAERAVFLAVDGHGTPGGLAYQSALQRLFGLASGARAALQRAGVMDFRLAPLECLWFGTPPAPPATWRWRLMLRVPNSLTMTLLKPVRKSLLDAKGLDTQAVKRILWREGRALQCLHRGPHLGLPSTYARLQDAAAARRLVVAGPAHEVYLNAPDRVGPERLRTIARLPVKSRKA
jgi:hypothetical protein